MRSLTSVENRCLLVRSYARYKSLPSFVRTMQRHFPFHFNDATFITCPLSERPYAERVASHETLLPANIIRQAIMYLIRLHYLDVETVFCRLRKKTEEDNVKHQSVQRMLKEVSGTTLKSVCAVIRLVYLECGKEETLVPDLSKMHEAIRRLIIVPAGETCRFLNHQVVYGYDRNIDTLPGCLITEGIVPVLTESAIWIISFSDTAASSDHRLRLLTLYVMMGQPATIKKVGIINPHRGEYHTLSVEEVEREKLTILRDCLYGTPALTKKVLHELKFEKRTVRQMENFSLWYRRLTQQDFLPSPYIGLLLSLAGGALEKGVPVDDMVDRLALERETIRQTGQPSLQHPAMFFIDTVMAILAANNVRQEDRVFVLGVAETLLRWFNRVSHFTRLTSLCVQSALFQDATNDVMYVQTNNQVAIVKLNFDDVTTQGTDILIRKQVKMNNIPGQPLKHGMLKNAPMISVVNPLLGEALCYETRALPSVVYDLVVSDYQ